MTPSLAQILRESQPAIVLATTIVFVCSNDRWPVAAAALVTLELAALLLALRRLHLRASSRDVRFVGRVAAAEPRTSARAVHPLAQRQHLHLVH